MGQATSIRDNSVGSGDYPVKEKEVIADPEDGVAANMDQGGKDAGGRYALAACLYEQVSQIVKKYSLQ